jgi:hypothetical protein
MTMRNVSAAAVDTKDQLSTLMYFMEKLEAWANFAPKTHRPVPDQCVMEDFFPESEEGKSTIADVEHMLTAVRAAYAIAVDLSRGAMSDERGPMFWREALKELDRARTGNQ